MELAAVVESELQTEFADDDCGGGGQESLRGEHWLTQDVGPQEDGGALHQSLPQSPHTGVLQAGDELQ